MYNDIQTGASFQKGEAGLRKRQREHDKEQLYKSFRNEKKPRIKKTIYVSYQSRHIDIMSLSYYPSSHGHLIRHKH